MSPLLSAAVGSTIRFCLAIGAGWLVRKGVWSDSAASTYVEAGTLGLLSWGWGIYEKWKRHELTGHWWWSRRFGQDG